MKNDRLKKIVNYIAKIIRIKEIKDLFKRWPQLYDRMSFIGTVSASGLKAVSCQQL
jgi:hypothetical protein